MGDNMKKLIYLSLLVIFVGIVNSALAGDVYVRGYVRSDGTFVKPHHRSSPDGKRSNNWSTKGNINPYTGKVGTKQYYNDPSPRIRNSQFKIHGRSGFQTEPLRYERTTIGDAPRIRMQPIRFEPPRLTTAPRTPALSSTGTFQSSTPSLQF